MCRVRTNVRVAASLKVRNSRGAVDARSLHYELLQRKPERASSSSKVPQRAVLGSLLSLRSVIMQLAVPAYAGQAQKAGLDRVQTLSVPDGGGEALQHKQDMRSQDDTLPCTRVQWWLAPASTLQPGLPPQLKALSKPQLGSKCTPVESVENCLCRTSLCRSRA